MPPSFCPIMPLWRGKQKRRSAAALYESYIKDPNLAHQALKKTLSKYDEAVKNAQSGKDIGDMYRDFFEVLTLASGVTIPELSPWVALGSKGAQELLAVRLGPARQMEVQDELSRYANLGRKFSDLIWAGGMQDLVLRDKVLNPYIHSVAGARIGQDSLTMLKNNQRVAERGDKS